MLYLCAGLLLFLGCHSLRIVAEDWRRQQIARVGELTWKAVYSLLSALGLALIVWGYGAARAEPMQLWPSPAWTRHLAALLSLPGFILIAAAYVPDNRIRVKLGHPMVLGTKLWAFAHLLANGTLADALLFGSFLLWAVFDFRAARNRDRRENILRSGGRASRDGLTVVIGLTVWAGFALLLHLPLIGVRPY